MFKFLKKLFKKVKFGNPVMKFKTEMEITVKRPDGSLKSYRKVVNDKETIKIDK